jgi:hypothetical protein
MKLLIGAYSQITHAEPVLVYERALDTVFKPLLTHIHTLDDVILQLSISIPFLDWLETAEASMHLLISDLARCGKLELLSGPYHQSILSFLTPKDRSNQIEMTTTYLRKRFSQRSKTLFSYGQVFTPQLINTANLCCIDSLVISTKDLSKDQKGFTEPFVMQELGKTVSIIPTYDPISELVMLYAQKQISFGHLLHQCKLQLEKQPVFCMAMINLDQLMQGGIQSEQLVQFFSLLFSFGSSSVEEVHAAQQLVKKGYLQAGWYGYDSVRTNLCCINDVLVKDESLAYLYGRYTNSIETARMYKKDKDVRKRLESLIQKMSIGSPFVCDANASMLRSSVRKLFWRSISETDCILSSLKDYSYPNEGDFDHDDLTEYLFIGKYLSCVVDAKGGSLSELTYLPSLFNYGDTFVPLLPFGKSMSTLHTVQGGTKQRLFTDVFLPTSFDLNEYSKMDEKTCLDMGKVVYDLAVLDRRNTEYKLTARTSDHKIIGGELHISKHFKLRQNTVLLDITLNNISDHPVQCIYGCEIPLSIDSRSLPIVFLQLENKHAISHEAREIELDEVKSLRIYDEPNSTSLTLVSDSRFTLLKEDYTIETQTILGEEQLYQHTLFLATWPLCLEAGAEKKITLGLRIERK